LSPELTLSQPRTLIFGKDCSYRCGESISAKKFARVLAICSPSTRRFTERLSADGCSVEVFSAVDCEPTISLFEEIRKAAVHFRPEAVVGLGGGSPLDVAKLVAALWNSEQGLSEVFGMGVLHRRVTPLFCLPTTAGTGSEVSPNSILLDQNNDSKRAVISPHLVPDETYVDPVLTESVPPEATAATGLDAMTHCIEAYANLNSHPAVDAWALQGISLISKHLERAVRNGSDYEAREAVALGSLLGGMCLGPVNTAGVHALAYPLAGQYHMAHGLSVAVMLPHVLRFNLSAMTERYAQIARCLGEEREGLTAQSLAQICVERIIVLSKGCGLTKGLSQYGISEANLPSLIEQALNVRRLLKNNPREISGPDAAAIYAAALGGL
jgi:alcohol dehydrogenase class IV